MVGDKERLEISKMKNTKREKKTSHIFLEYDKLKIRIKNMKQIHIIKKGGDTI